MNFENLERKSRFEAMNEERRAGLVDDDHLRFLSSLGDIDARRLFPDVELISFFENLRELLSKIDNNQKTLFMITISEKVIHYYDEVAPKDKRIPRALQYARWSFGEPPLPSTRFRSQRGSGFGLH